MMHLENSTQPVLQDFIPCVVYVKPQLHQTREQDYPKKSPHHLLGMRMKCPKAMSMLRRTVRAALELNKSYWRIQLTLCPKERSQQLRMRTLKMMRNQQTTLGCIQIWMLYVEGAVPSKHSPEQEHPAACKKLMKHGNRGPTESKMGQACDKLHPKMCQTSLRTRRVDSTQTSEVTPVTIW